MKKLFMLILNLFAYHSVPSCQFQVQKVVPCPELDLKKLWLYNMLNLSLRGYVITGARSYSSLLTKNKKKCPDKLT